MCGRYSIYRSKMEYENALEAAGGLSYAGIPIDMAYSYDITPYQKQHLPIVEDGKLSFAQWGMVPTWWKKPVKEARYTFNATVEKIAEGSSMWRRPFLRQRCLVPMSGFYEWQYQPDGSSVRHLIRLNEPEMFACAGIWDQWKQPDGTMLKSFAIITCPANKLLAKIHNRPRRGDGGPRMPVILTGETAAAWAKPDAGLSHDDLLGFLKPLPSSEMLAYPVRSAAQDSGELVVPIGDPVTA